MITKRNVNSKNQSVSDDIIFKQIDFFGTGIRVKVLGSKELVRISDAILIVGSISRFYKHHYCKIHLYNCDGTKKKNRSSNSKTFINLKDLI